MKNFPDFIRNPLNKVDPESQHTPGIEGYVFDGADGSQMVFWTYKQNAVSEQHSHDYDEYTVVVKGQYTIIIDGKRYPLNPGDEFVIEKGILHSSEAIAGTRAIYAFGGKRAIREIDKG